jgi:hypothetical protein
MGNEFVQNEFVLFVVSVTNYWIWKNKLQKQFLPASVLLDDINHTVRRALRLSNKLDERKVNNNFFICRFDFFRHAGRGRP